MCASALVLKASIFVGIAKCRNLQLENSCLLLLSSACVVVVFGLLSRAAELLTLNA